MWQSGSGIHVSYTLAVPGLPLNLAHEMKNDPATNRSMKLGPLIAAHGSPHSILPRPLHGRASAYHSLAHGTHEACLHAKLLQFLCDPMDCDLPGSCIHGIL